MNLIQQLKNHAVAIASIFIALTGLGYTTWRDETTEVNRNIRFAAFESLKQLNELQLIVNAAHYGMDPKQGSPLLGWSRVVMVRDLADLLPPPAMQNAEQLYGVWEQNWEGLGHEQLYADRITNVIAQNREGISTMLRRLR